jgi:HEAT repeat protein
MLHFLIVLILAADPSALTSQLSAPESSTRLEALRAILSSGKAPVALANTLIELAESDPDTEVALNAVYAIGLMGPEGAAIAPRLEAFASPDHVRTQQTPRFREGAVCSLLRLGRLDQLAACEKVARTITYGQHSLEELNYPSAALWVSGEKGKAIVLAAAAGEEDDFQRGALHECWDAVARGEDLERVTLVLLKSLDFKYDGSRSEEIRSLYQQVGPPARAIFEKAAESPNNNIHKNGAIALFSKAADSGDVAYLLTTIRDRDADIRAWSAISLGTHLHAEAAIPALVEMLNDKDAKARGVAAGCLGEFGAKAAAGMPGIIALLKDKDRDARSQAACAVGQIGGAPHEVVPQLIHLLDDKNGWVRGCAAFSLGELDAMESVDSLISRLADRNPKAMEGIEGALGRLGGKSPTVAIAVGQWVAANPRKPHNVAARALSFMGANAEGALPQLMKMVNELEDSTSVWSVRAVNECPGHTDEILPVYVECLEKRTCDASEVGKALIHLGKLALPLLPRLEALDQTKFDSIEWSDVSYAILPLRHSTDPQ